MSPVVELPSPCCGGDRCQRCGLPVRSPALLPPRCTSPLERPRPLSTDTNVSRSSDVTSGPRFVTFVDDDAEGRSSTNSARKRVRFAPMPPTDDATDDVSSQLVPVTTSPLLPSSSFVKMQQTVGHQLPVSTPAQLVTFVGLSGDASIV